MMKSKHLIIGISLLLPVTMAHGQAAPSPAAPTPSQEASAGNQAAAGGQTGVQAAPATEADLAKGKVVNDPSGKPVGTIDSTTEAGVVLTVGQKRVQIPRNAIGKNEAGLVISVTKAELEAAAGKASS
jgi:hypothetical protein